MNGVNSIYDEMFNDNFNLSNIENKAQWIRNNKDNLSFLLKNGYTQKQIANLLKCSLSYFNAVFNDYYKRHKEKLIEKQKEYYYKNKESYAEYYKNNQDRKKQYQKEYYDKNKERIISNRKQYLKKLYSKDPDLKIYYNALWAFTYDYKLSNDNICQLCNNIDSDLHVHHYYPKSLYPELAFDENNLIILCKGCHYYIHRTRDTWIDLIDEQVIT